MQDPLLAEILTTSKQCVVSFHEHDSLLENQVEQTLTEEEKKSAWEEYENEKKGIVVRGRWKCVCGFVHPCQSWAVSVLVQYHRNMSC